MKLTENTYLFLFMINTNQLIKCVCNIIDSVQHSNLSEHVQQNGHHVILSGKLMFTSAVDAVSSISIPLLHWGEGEHLHQSLRVGQSRPKTEQ